MEDLNPLSSSAPSLGLHSSSSAKAKKLQDTSTERALSQSKKNHIEEKSLNAPLKHSSHFLDLLEKLKTHPTPAVQELKPPPSPEHPRIEAIKRGEELLLKEGWPSAEDLDQVAHILGEQFE